ncbi:MAG TPA: C-GCAxxG-C-C family protein [Clostridia bacterium]
MEKNKAGDYYLGKEGHNRMNCAQAVICAFKDIFGISDDTIEKFGEYGGGRAPDGLCGAYYAAKYILKEKEKCAELESYFLNEAGSIKCNEIRSCRRLSCLGCVEKSAEFIENNTL